MFDEKIQLPKSMNWLKISTIVLTVITVALGGVLVYGMYNQPAEDEMVAVTSAVAEVSATPESDVIVDVGVTWQKPQKLDDLGLFEEISDGEYSGTDYYKVGTTSSKANIILAVVKVEAMGLTEHIYRFIEGDEKYQMVVQNSDAVDWSQYNLVGEKTEQDRTFAFKSLLNDKVITEGQTQLSSAGSLWFANEQTNAQKSKIADTPWGPLYRDFTRDISINSIDEESSDEETVTKVARYYVELNDSTKMTYEPRPTFLRDDYTFDVDYKVADAEGLSFDKIATSGCGVGFGSFPSIVIPTSLSDSTLIGSNQGSSIYTIEDSSNKLVEFSYAVYNMDGAEGKLSLDEFAGSTPIIYWKNAYGDSILYLNSEFTPNVECGKPVVYLYPEEATDFTVKVGADVTKSEPLYNGGWQGIAQPDGSLAVAGQTYGSLFWEGLGWGEYPVVDFGRIVQRDSVEKEIVFDLSKMNLNETEIADFLEFWMPRMPESKYVRLSWLTNAELDVLAPLQVMPKPDSVIRVFLDFAGLGKEVAVKSQELPVISRDGFTVIEWGGLLRGE